MENGKWNIENGTAARAWRRPDRFNKKLLIRFLRIAHVASGSIPASRRVLLALCVPQPSYKADDWSSSS